MASITIPFPAPYAHAVQLPEAITPASGSILRQPMRGAVRSMNLFGPIAARELLLSPLVHDANQSAGGFSKAFDWFLSRVVAHAAKHAARSFVNVRKSIGEIRNVVC